MFVLRCAFWLSIVYLTMAWKNGIVVVPQWAAERATATRAAETPVAARLTQTLATAAAGVCARQPATCLADAARLTALVDAAVIAEDQPDAPAPGPAKVARPAAPRPVPDPRRRMRVLLTRAP